MYANDDAKVIEYRPAPGQFINTIPQYTDGDDETAIIEKANSALEMGSFFTLGGYGGYVTFKLSNSVVNNGDGYHFSILGNAYSNSSEPGIVMVMKDENRNGLADDTWYEIAGSEYDNSTRNYRIVYYRPEVENEEACEDYVMWKDNLGNTEYLPKISFHTQSYYPLWEDADSLVFEGTLLPNNGFYRPNTNFYELKPFEWGYADNHKNSLTDSISFKLSWAVDATGNSVYLDEVHFIKVFTGINQLNGQLGECSTEVAGITNLSPGESTVGGHTISETEVTIYTKDGQIIVSGESNCEYKLYSLSGAMLDEGYIDNGVIKHQLNNGVYLLRYENKTHKIIIN